jgi:translation initiation factor IF-2
MARPFHRPNTQRRPGQRPGARRGSGGRNRGPMRSGFMGSAPAAVLERQPVELAARMTVQELADRLGVSPTQVISELVGQNILLTINQSVDYDTAAMVAGNLGFTVMEAAAPEARENGAADAPAEDEALLVTRPPVVTVMGHVDHGKTSLLDAIRNTNVTGGEAGGITQHIGAYQVEIHDRRITFLDTPGHEAFTAMRARGAQATDIVILVVAADDGVMPQTREAIAHCQAANVPVVVAINKIDRPNAERDRVIQQLAEAGLVAEQYGGDVPAVGVSAKTQEGIQDLLDVVLLVADIHDFKANPARPASGVVIEAKLDRARGPVATVLVQTGTMHVGDVVVAGGAYGKVKALFNDRGQRVRQAGPSVPAEILGLNGVAEAGDPMQAVVDEKIARQMVDPAARAGERDLSEPRRDLSLQALSSQIQAGEVKEVTLVVKTDVQGSIEPILNSLARLEDETGIRIKVLHSGTGNVSDSDILLAAASKGIIIGFNVRADPSSRRVAESQGVDIRLYTVIYHLVDDVRRALAGMLEPEYREIVRGQAEIRQAFRAGKTGQAAGCLVLEGTIGRNSLVRIKRGREVLFEGRIQSLRRVKDDVREVTAGQECGMTFDGFNDFDAGDVVEAYERELVSSGARARRGAAGGHTSHFATERADPRDPVGAAAPGDARPPSRRADQHHRGGDDAGSRGVARVLQRPGHG